MSLWTWAWIGWGVYFALVEGMALFTSHPGGTLSQHAWAWLGYNTGDRWRHPSGWTRLRRFLLLAFLAWLVVHLLTGGVF